MSLRQTAQIVCCLALAPLASGCATMVENRVETGLAEAGIPTGLAGCMAEIWANDLSNNQIREIARFADAVRDKGQPLTPRRLIDHVGEWNDPKALRVVTMSAARCAFG